jgi:NitT/TauT family transport system substrate-binding protein
VRKDAPKFASAKQALEWLNGKQVAVPKGSCTDRFAQAVFKKDKIEPAAYLNQNIEVITSNLRAGKLDAAVIWEPTASRLVLDGLARRIASGASVDENDAALLAARYDLIKQRPDVIKGWLNAELDAELYVADPKNAMEVAKMAVAQTTGFNDKVMWMSLYGAYPASEGGDPVRNTYPFTFTPPSLELINRAATFLHSIKSINVDKLRADAVMPQFTQEILKERGLTPPIAEIKGQPESTFK